VETEVFTPLLANEEWVKVGMYVIGVADQ